MLAQSWGRAIALTLFAQKFGKILNKIEQLSGEMDAIVKLHKKIANESLQERQKTEPTHRYYTRPHRMNVVPLIHDGKYLETSPRQMPPPELVASQDHNKLGSSVRTSVRINLIQTLFRSPPSSDIKTENISAPLAKQLPVRKSAIPRPPLLHRFLDRLPSAANNR